MQADFNPKIVSKVIIWAPDFTSLPDGMLSKWLKNTQAGIPQMIKHINESIHSSKDYDEKIVQKSVEAYKKSINPNYISQGGKNKEDIIKKLTDNRKKGMKQYFSERKKVFRRRDGIPHKRYQESLYTGMKKYEENYLNYVLPMVGHKTLGKGLATLAAGWLAGDKKVKNFLRDADTIITGEPILICPLEKKGLFQNKLRNHLVFWGRLVLYDPLYKECRKEANEQINQLVQVFTRSEFAPFSPDGASHIDFVIPKIIDPMRVDKIKIPVGLEIQVAHK